MISGIICRLHDKIGEFISGIVLFSLINVDSVSSYIVPDNKR